MIEIIFESHATSVDNEKQIASGHFDARLSARGKEEALKLGRRYEHTLFDAIFCSDLQRSYQTAEIGFPQKKELIIQDSRLRECHYGVCTHQLNADIEKEKLNYIDIPFPNGESYRQATDRIQAFLQEISHLEYQRVLIIGHRVTQYGLEHHINDVPLEQALSASWSWQPGWKYLLKKAPHFKI